MAKDEIADERARARPMRHTLRQWANGFGTRTANVRGTTLKDLPIYSCRYQGCMMPIGHRSLFGRGGSHAVLRWAYVACIRFSGVVCS